MRALKLVQALGWVLLVAGLASFYYAGATAHGQRVNTSKARGDQSGYLYDAQVLYRNWHGLNEPPRLVDRNRMPLYGAYLAALYDPSWTDPEFFEKAKHQSIVLSMVLLAVLAMVLFRYLPPLAAANLLLVVAFGYFVFKAGYTQSELLFYTMFFLAFVASWRMLSERRPGRKLALAGAAGVLSALAHLTKAVMLPFAVLFLLVALGQAVGPAFRGRRGQPVAAALRSSAVRAGAALVFAAVFLSVLSPYLSNSKRVFRQYFYNVNSTFYVWYDDWPQASVGTYSHGDHVGWPKMPRSELPGPGRYWREHTVGQIAARLGGGFRDMVVRSYQTFWYFKYVAMYAAFAALLLVVRWDEVRSAVSPEPAVRVFVLLYLAVYMVATAFYAPTSGTGTTRFLLAHVAPALFLLSRLVSHADLATRPLSVAGVPITPVHFQLAVAVSMALDIAFVIWPRLMTTYGGF